MVLLFCGLYLTGCYGDLEPINHNEINPSIFPKTEEDLKTMVLSCYNPLRGSWWNGINSTSERGQMYLNDCCTEIITSKYGPGKLCSELSFKETNDEVTWFYFTRDTENYGAQGYLGKISRCTLVMDEIKNSTLDDTKKNRYIAEVRCARAFMSYILFDMYGPLTVAPIEVLKDPTKEVSLPRLSNEEMVSFIEDDLLFAAQYLPMPRAAEYGKFSAGFANMLLIRLYLHETTKDKSYYNKVETLARKMMTPEFGYSMVSSYPSLFEFAGQTANNPEYIFVIPSAYSGPGENQWHMMVMPPDIDGPIKGWQSLQSTWWFYDTFEPNDTRKTYLIPEYTTTEGEERNRNNPGETLDLGPIPQKYQIDKGVAGNNGLTDLDIVMYRYPDVLLSLAEAIVMQPGGSVTNEAVELLNDVRERAGLGRTKSVSNYPTKEAFIEALLTERSHEFWCESGQYRADLIRFDKLLDRVMELNAGVAPYASKDKYLYPLPLSAIVDGKGQVKQNKGYAE